jgi:hypothetical protein
MKKSYIPLIISLAIILHHFKKHDKNPEFSLLDKFVQVDDINNHETWALFFLGISIGMIFK